MSAALIRSLLDEASPIHNAIGVIYHNQLLDRSFGGFGIQVDATIPIPWLVGRSKIGIGDVLSMSFQGSVFTVIWKMFHKLPEKGVEKFKIYLNAYKFNHRFL